MACLLGLLGRGSRLPPLQERGDPSHFVNGGREGQAEDVGRIEGLRHPAGLIAKQVLLMGQLQKTGVLGAASRAAARHVGKLARFHRDLVLPLLEILDRVLQPGLLLQGKLGLDFETLLAELSLALKGRGLSLSRLRCSSFLAPCEHRGVAAVLAGVVDLLPEFHKIIDGGDGGDQHREVYGGDGDPLDRNNEHAEVPLVPAMSENG